MVIFVKNMKIEDAVQKREFSNTDKFKLPIYEKKATIGYSTIGKQGTLKIVSIMNFLQDAASEHADLMGVSGFDLAKENLSWVIFRYHIEIKNHPNWNDKVTIKTHRFSCKNLYEIRALNIIKYTQKCLAKREKYEIVNAKVCWVMVNRKNGKPVRLSKFMDKEMLTSHEVQKDNSVEFLLEQDSSDQINKGVESYFPEIIKPEIIHYQLPFKVRMHDLDLNGHVNNAIFVEWGVETVPERVLSNFSPATIDVIFNKESLYGDIIVSHTEIRENTGTLLTLHSIIRQQDQVELARLNIQWSNLPKRVTPLSTKRDDRDAVHSSDGVDNI